jgi:hypothetical protein
VQEPTPAGVVTNHLKRLQDRLARRSNESPEALLADLVPDLVKGVGELLNRPGIDLLGQAYEGDLGRPDFSVKDGLLLLGHVETKPPGAGADTRRFRGHNRRQWNRFSRLPNVLYCDGTDFALYRSGERVGSIVKLAFDETDTQAEAGETEARALVELLSDFLSWRAVAPRTLRELAERLAPLCAVLRDAVRNRLEDRESEVARAAAEVEDALFADRGPDEVADAFAQVCTYSMLLARSRGAARLRPSEIESTLRQGHPVLGRVVRLLVDEATEDELGWALDTVRMLVEAVDFPTLEAKKGSDTWLYFYETFLAEYDPRLRDQYGVYYTPAPVISAQVALLDEILRTRLGKAAGLASDGVTVLDPAVGTGSYPLRVIQAAADTARETRGAGAVPGVVTNLARNLFAFEILVGPYAVAHLRISELIAREGGTLPEEGPHVYLTDTLDNPYAEPLDFGRQLEPLVEERRRALKVKSGQEILVCLGNPPYERLSKAGEEGQEKGGWVVHGEGGGAAAPPIFSAFIDPANEHTMFSHVASLYNLYVYFWRWALWKVLEAPHPNGSSNGRPGVVSFITASSHLTGPGFLGMREHLRRSCDEVWVLDLGGEGHGARKEENVFAIQTPVAICIACRGGPGDAERPATVRYARIHGTRAEKLAALTAVKALDDLEWEEAQTGWHDPFVPGASADWLRFPALTDLFPWALPGTKVNRTWPIAVTREGAEERWAELAAAPRSDKSRYFVDTRFGRTSATAPQGRVPVPASLERIVDLTADSPVPAIARYGYRSFDRQWILADSRVINLPRPTLWCAAGDSQIHLVSLLTGRLGSGPAATVSAHVPDLHYFRGRGGRDVIPLYRDSEGTPNIAKGALTALERIHGRPVAAEDLFAYAYAILGSPAYTERFWEELEVPGPRVPIPRDPALFERGVGFGRCLINLHTFGERYPELGQGVNPAQARLTEPIGPHMPEEFAYDADARELRVGPGVLAPVAPDVWEYEVSGLLVLRSWLRYRMRRPVGRASSSSSPLDAIRPPEWTSELDAELLELVWVLERTVEAAEAHRDLLDKVLAAEVIAADELPQPTDDERTAPRTADTVDETDEAGPYPAGGTIR